MGLKKELEEQEGEEQRRDGCLQKMWLFGELLIGVGV